MAPQTTSQIISLGEYLEPGYDPSKLTIPQLAGLFNYHNVQYPSQANKAKLVKLFQEEVASRAEEFKRQRLQREDTAPSEEGIMDGVTGQPIAPPRRVTRRSSRQPSIESHEPPKPELPKRRRSSAQPSLGRVNTRASSTRQPIVIEESEDDAPPEALPKVSRKKTSQTAGNQARRVSQKIGPGNEDSGWEDHNIFQSGAESSSPARPAKPQTGRKIPRKSRTSMSAPPEPTSSSPLRSPLPQTDFNPILPLSVSRRGRPSGFGSFSVVSPKEEIDDMDFLQHEDSRVAVNHLLDTMPEDDDDADMQGDDEDEDYNLAVSQKIAEGGTKSLIRRQSLPNSTPAWLQVLLWLAILIGSGISVVYKLESEPLGYCDTGKSTNKALEAFKAKQHLVDHCRLTISSGNVTVPADCPPLALIPLPMPNSCTPCPDHGQCTRADVTCDNGYVYTPHVLSYIPGLSTAANGLPGLGPVAFPPQCKVDERRRKNIGVLGRAMESQLAQMHGARTCKGRTPAVQPDDGGEARRWGVELQPFKKSISSQTADNHKGDFDENFSEAMRQLSEARTIITGKDKQGRLYVASERLSMDWACQITVAVRNAWNEWRATVGGTVLLVILGFLTRLQMASSKAETKRVAELVQVALDALRSQELAYHTDPVTGGRPYLSPLQLRDLVLQDEHDVKERQRVWKRVERVVEGNANVRANLEETPMGDETRVWRWVGSASPTKRIQ